MNTGLDAAFLDSLAARSRTLAETTQADRDRVFAHSAPHLRATLRPFLHWAMTTRRMPRLTLPSAKERPATLITSSGASS